MTKLSKDTVLRIAAGLRVEIDSSSQLRIDARGRSILCGPQGLAALQAFTEPRPLSEALRLAQAAGLQDWVDLTSTIVALWRAGALIEEGAGEPEPDAAGFGSAPIHVAMLNNRPRTEALLRGIREVVRPGDVVVDIGTGTGILAIAAASAGAEHVYAIEASAMAGVARRVVERAGLSERITVIQGWSTRLTLPRRADVLVSEIIGNDPFGERVLEVTRDALRRHLVAAPRMVPGRIRLFGLPISIPEEALAEHAVTDRALADWKEWYAIDFGPLRDLAQASEHPQMFVTPAGARAFRRLSSPLLLCDVDLASLDELVIDREVLAAIPEGGRLDGLLVYFELSLGPTTRLSTDPGESGERASWRCPIWLLPERRELAPGSGIRVRYQYGVHRRGSAVHVAVDEPAAHTDPA